MKEEHVALAIMAVTTKGIVSTLLRDTLLSNRFRNHRFRFKKVDSKQFYILQASQEEGSHPAVTIFRGETPADMIQSF